MTATAAAGCTSGSGSAPAEAPGGAVRRTGTSISTAPPGPDVALAARLLAAERVLAARVGAVQRRHPGVAVALSDARAIHRAHARLLRRAVPDPDPQAPRPSRVRVPGSVTDALSALADDERGLGALQRSLALQSRSGPFARVLACMAAATAQQVEQLTVAAARARR